jgi:hypothetical protein
MGYWPAWHRSFNMMIYVSRCECVIRSHEYHRYYSTHHWDAINHEGKHGTVFPCRHGGVVQEKQPRMMDGWAEAPPQTDTGYQHPGDYG